MANVLISDEEIIQAWEAERDSGVYGGTKPLATLFDVDEE